MTEDIETSTRQDTVEDIPSAVAQQSADSGKSAPQSASRGSAIQQRAAEIANERPEVAAGAAFAGGLLLAVILKRIAR